ncbi:DUF2510 domain-containing protein [Kitasatospora sp. NPDC057542]|uniref:DUF2510 domain-containing protein n=1 Tax=Streptomycetaceae TaxID=2062 RepID=UPI001CC9747F|nr:DUF2510 domain-containing protein [Streptomyces sp. LS1784]
MTNSTPPGWYPVPGADNSPGYERWWDGNAWTNEVRPLQAGAVQPGYGHPGQNLGQAPGYGYPGASRNAHPGAGYGYPGPGYPPAPGPRRTRLGVIIGVVVGVLAVGGTVAAFAFRDGGDPQAGPTPSPTVSASRSTGFTPSPTPTPAPTTARPVPSVTGIWPDPQHAITVPILDGWATETDRPNLSWFEGTGQYSCNGGHRCVRGMFAIGKDTVQGTTAKDAADSAMPDFANGLYPGVTQHTDYGSGPMSVDGVPGYAERWHVQTLTGTQGYVLLATFPTKGGGYVVFKGSVDDDALSPDKDALEQILTGIKQMGSSSSS